MVLVRILKDYDDIDILRQTPSGSGVWGEIKFTEEPILYCDYVVVLNRTLQDVKVHCPPENVWALMQEPPNEHFKASHRASATFAKVYTQDVELTESRYVHKTPALPWHVHRTYDELRHAPLSDKKLALSCISSNATAFEGHRQRLKFIKALTPLVKFDLYGRGFRYIEDKWDALAPYRYSIVIENFSNPYYWSEKLADCILAGTIAFYHGCTRIHDYFSPEVVIPFDINDPTAAAELMRKAVAKDSWKRSQSAIQEARQLILDRYQLFPFLAREIEQAESEHKTSSRRLILIEGQPYKKPTLLSRIRLSASRYFAATRHR